MPHTQAGRQIRVTDVAGATSLCIPLLIIIQAGTGQAGSRADRQIRVMLQVRQAYALY